MLTGTTDAHPHPLSRTLTRARDAGDALRALVVAAEAGDRDAAITIALALSRFADEATFLTETHPDRRVRCAAGKLRRALREVVAELHPRRGSSQAA